MRIEGIHIDGFGRFHEQPFTPLAPGMNVFIGPNEAGKSTLLAFMQTVLYGFPRLRRNEFYPPLDGGQHGGRLWIADEQGRPYIVARYANAAGKDLTITLPDASETASEDVLRQLLSGASRDVFTSVFSFGIAELQAIESLSGGEIGSQIYSAGIGAGAVPAALAALAKQEEELFRKRGQKHRFAEIAQELDDVEQSLRERHDDDATFAALERERESLRGASERLAAEHATLQRQASRAERLRDAWPAWSRHERLRGEIAPIGDVRVQPAALARLEALEAALLDAEAGRTEEGHRAAAAAQAVQAISVDETLLGAAHTIERLRTGQETHDSALRDLPKREAELAVAQSALQSALGEMGGEWTLESSLAVDTANARRIGLEELQQRLGDAGRELERRNNRLEAAREHLDQRRAEHRRTSNALVDAGAVPPEQEAERALQLLQACVDARNAIPVGAPRMGWSSRAGALVLGAGPGAIAGWLVLGLSGAIAGGLLGAGAGLLAGAGRTDPERAAAVAAFVGALGAAGIDEPRLHAAVRRADDELRRARDQARLLQAEREAAASLDDAGLALKRAAEERDAAEAALGLLRARWSEFSSSAGLGPDTTPAIASHLMGQARLVAERARAVAELEHRTGAIGRDIDAFRELVGAAVAGCRRESAAALDPSDAAQDLVTALDEARANQRSRVEAERQQTACEARLAEWERKVAQQQDALARWLAANDARDPQDLHTKVAVSEVREGLLRELRECEIRLAEAGGDRPGLERLKAELETSDPDALQSESKGLADSLAVLASERDALLERRGGVERELLDLRNREGTSALLLKRERLRAELQSVVQRWSEVRIARRLIERTRGIYEAERQPQVVKAAEGYFAAMTGGRYTRVIAPLGEQTLRVSDDLHAPKTPDQLSRGTREQLYLALRFGLIDQFAERSGPLPVAVDEVLVNFDPDRALEAARGFARLSRRHQVIAFTCHPWVVELFKTAEPNARVWELSSERAVPAFATPLTR